MGKDKDVYTTKDLAKEAGVSDAYIRQLIADGRIKAEKLGHIWVIAKAEVKRWLSQR